MRKFGERRLLQTGIRKWLFWVMGIADPAHYLHSRYFRLALAFLPGFEPRKVLDAGCGPGDYTFYLARRFPVALVVALDVDPERIERCRQTANQLDISNARFEVADLARAQLGEAYDLVIAIDVLEHIADQPQALAAIATALAPGGYAFFHIPTRRQKPVPFSSRLRDFHVWAEHEHVAELLTFEQFLERVRGAGLEIIRARPTFGYFTGELATSLFNLSYADTPVNRLLQGLLSPACRLLAWADLLNLEKTRYAVAVLARKPSPALDVPP